MRNLTATEQKALNAILPDRQFEVSGQFFHDIKTARSYAKICSQMFGESTFTVKEDGQRTCWAYYQGKRGI